MDQNKLIKQILEASKVIAAKGTSASANHIMTSKEVADIIQKLNSEQKTLERARKIRDIMDKMIIFEDPKSIKKDE